MSLTSTAESLKTRTASAARWRIARSFVVAATQFAVGVLLARLLTPADFGLAALAYVVLGLAQPLADVGLGLAVIRRADLSERNLRAAFTGATLAGIAVTALVAAAAPLGAAALRNPRVTPLLRVLSAGIAIRATASVADALLRRDLDFKRHFVIEIASYLFGFGSVAVCLALLGYGVWSLVWGALAQALMAAGIQLAVVRPPLRPLFAKRELRDLLGFGVGASVSSTVNYVALNADYLVVGRLMGPFALGLYSRAYELMNLPHTYVANVMSNIMFPALSRVQDETARVRSAYLQATRLTAMIAGPSMMIIAIAAPALVPGVYGPRWIGMVIPLEVLSMAGYFRALYHLGGVVAQTRGRVYGELWRQIVYAALVIAGAAAGSRGGLAGVAAGVSLAILYMFVATAHLALNATATSWRAYLRTQTGALMVAAVTGAVAFLVRFQLRRWHASDLVIALVVIGAAAVPWAAGFLWMLGDPECEPFRSCLPTAAHGVIAPVVRLRAGGSRSVTRGRPSPPAGAHVLIERTTLAPPAGASGGIRAFAKCRNECLRLPAFLRHYRALGVDRFFIVDNGSTDGSAEYLADQSDVHVFRTDCGFSEARGGMDWLNAMLREFGAGFWCLTVDIDELLVYSGSEEAPLPMLTAHLDRHGYEAMSCLLLDLYPGGPLSETQYKAGDDLLQASPYFDAGPYLRWPVDRCPNVLVRGGMRERVFYPDVRARGGAARSRNALLTRLSLRFPSLRGIPGRGSREWSVPPCLTKIPLVRWDRDTQYLNAHFVSPKVVAPDSGALLHFKFLQDFPDRVVHEAARGEYFDAGSEYGRYALKVGGDPGLTLRYAGSARYEGSSQLVRLGLIEETADWAAAKAPHVIA